MSAGFIPVLAHPERNKDLQREPDRVLDLIEGGALIQITTGSPCGYWGLSAMECALEFMRKDVVFAIASDGHSAVRRPPEMCEGLEILGKMFGEDKTKEILINGEKIIRE